MTNIKDKVIKRFFIYSQDENFSKFKEILNSHAYDNIEHVQDIEQLIDHLDKDDALVVSCLAIIRPLKRPLDDSSIKFIKEQFHNQSNRSLLIAGGENHRDNLNKLLSSLYGFRFKHDCVIGLKLTDNLYHPNEVVLSSQLDDFIVNRGLIESMKELNGNSLGTNVNILYPFGCTLKAPANMKSDNGNQLSTVMMTTSSKDNRTMPQGQPICIFYDSNIKSQSSFKMVAFGSSRMFADQYIELEQNHKLISSFIHYLNGAHLGAQDDSMMVFKINMSDANTLEITKNLIVKPDLDTMSQYPMLPMMRRKKLPKNAGDLFDDRLFNLDNSKLIDIRQTFQDLNVEHKPLTLIKPEFMKQTFPLLPAVHKFIIRKF